MCVWMQSNIGEQCMPEEALRESLSNNKRTLCNAHALPSTRCLGEQTRRASPPTEKLSLGGEKGRRTTLWHADAFVYASHVRLGRAHHRRRCNWSQPTAPCCVCWVQVSSGRANGGTWPRRKRPIARACISDSPPAFLRAPFPRRNSWRHSIVGDIALLLLGHALSAFCYHLGRPGRRHFQGVVCTPCCAVQHAARSVALGCCTPACSL